MNIINIQKAAHQRLVSQCLSINCIWPFISFLINHSRKRYLLMAVHCTLVANASKQFFQVPQVSCSYTTPNKPNDWDVSLSEHCVCVSSGNTGEAHRNLCKTLLWLFSVEWIIDSLLLGGCLDFTDFPKDMSKLSSQPLKDFRTLTMIVSLLDKQKRMP